MAIESNWLWKPGRNGERVGISPSEFLLRELRRRRKAAGMTQIELGKRCFCSDTVVSGIETGTKPVTLDYLKLVDTALETGGYFETLWTELVKDDAAPVWFREWIEIEREAAFLRWYRARMGARAVADRGVRTGDAGRGVAGAGGGGSAGRVANRPAGRASPRNVRPCSSRSSTRRPSNGTFRAVPLVSEQLDYLATARRCRTCRCMSCPLASACIPDLAARSSSPRHRRVLGWRTWTVSSQRISRTGPTRLLRSPAGGSASETMRFPVTNHSN